MATIDEIRRAALRALKPPPRLPLDDWIESEIRLPAGVSAIPGRIRLWPFQREIARAIADPLIERVCLLKPVRVGFTTLLSGALGHYVRNEPSPVLCVLPTEDDCKSYLRDEIEPIFGASPALASVLSENEGGRDTMLARRFAGGSLRLVAAKAQRNLRRLTARVLLIDEADAMEPGPEGDPIALAEKRTMTFADRKIVLGSSPVHADTSRVCRAYEESDARVYEVPCPECGTFTEIMWEHIVWPEGDPGAARYRCPECETEIDERHKAGMVENGEWRATKPDVAGRAGFRLNALVSPHRNAAWGKLAGEFLTAKRNPDTLQTFVNTILAQPWDGGGEEIDPSALANRAESFGLEAVPEAVRWLTAGVDVQRDRLEILFVGWSADGTALALGQAVIWGDPHGGETWNELDDCLRQTFPHPYGGRLAVDAACVDSGDGETAAAVLDYTQPRRNRRIYAVKGQAGARPAVTHSRTADKRRLLILGVDGLKARLVARLAPNAQPGIRFSRDLEPRFFEELTSERRQIRYRKGAPIVSWERRRGMRAEGLDCAVYAFAARETIKSAADRREADLRQTPEAVPRRKATLRRPRWLERGPA